MTKYGFLRGLTRRELLRLSTAAAAGIGVHFSGPKLAFAALEQGAAAGHGKTAEEKLYSDLLQSWCDGLLAHQIDDGRPAAFAGRFFARLAD